MSRLPGVVAVEPYREVPVRIRKGPLERRVMLSGRPRDADLSRIIDVDLRPVILPQSVLAISSWLARTLDAKVGDIVEIDLLEGQRRTVSLPLTALVEDYFGMHGMMDADTLARLMRESPAVNAVNVSLGTNKLDEFYEAIKAPANSRGARAAAPLADQFPQGNGGDGDDHGKHLHRTCRPHCLRRGLQQRTDLAV